MSELVPLDNLVADLRAAVEEGKSGAFFITTQDRHSAMITLDDGTITGVKYRSARGYDAAQALAASAHVKYQSAAEPTELPGEATLESARVLGILATATPPPAPERAADADAGPAATPAIDLEALRARYIAAIGPIAGTLFDEAVDELGDDLGSEEGTETLIRRLAAQIDDEHEARRFLADARAGR